MPEQHTAQELADAVLAHPSVARLHGGAFGEIASYFPGQRITGVRMSEDGPVEIGVVLRLDRPLTETLDDLRGALAERLGGTRVDIYVSDVDAGDDAPEAG
ncbi:hypothetical protein QFW96_22935 [Saccharopolyspora sp. TS4A08]|uniref:Asp23/Gls24 family envelope stress response protein n=1 Tax=Saccharopolyspora ipomoeae TaxID=3042027 RepID=A0ABT6PU17_9PSEU|nr:hypothetical protein [Saccharopolyspora sp. TS4A08]MDI2031502.1 hypothetical protein [Saccharopolyspora sp. TS4A08]